MVKGVKMNWGSMGLENTFTQEKDKYIYWLILMQNGKQNPSRDAKRSEQQPFCFKKRPPLRHKNKTN